MWLHMFCMVSLVSEDICEMLINLVVFVVACLRTWVLPCMYLGGNIHARRVVLMFDLLVFCEC